MSNALGGNSKTTVVCAISPAASNYNESRNTLLFATRCQKVSKCVGAWVGGYGR